MKYERNLTNIYNLESDDRLTLPDDTISVFEYDMIKGNLKGEKISGGNWIKLASMPAKVNVYWNSKFDRQTAKLLNESNRGIRILKQNDSLRLMTFQNFYIWTEGDLEDVENWSDKQRRLVIETSGAGAEIEALIANPSSDIYVDKVESVGDINHLMNFGKKDTTVEAGNWAKNMKLDSSKVVSNTESIKENTATSNENETTIIENLEALNTTQTSVKQNLETANASLDTANASLEAIKTEQSKQGTQLETSNANTQSAATSLLAIKDKQATDSLTLTNMSTNLMAIKANTQGLAKDSNLTDFKGANHTDLTNLDSNLTDFKGANHTDLTNLASKIETGLGALSQGLQLLNLEATQQSIVEKINTINLQLNTLNTLISAGGLGGNQKILPPDFEIEFFNFVNSNNIPFSLGINNHYIHYHIIIVVNNNTTGFNDERFTPAKRYVKQNINNNLEIIDITDYKEQAPRLTENFRSKFGIITPVYLLFKSNYQFTYKLQFILSFKSWNNNGTYGTFDRQTALNTLWQKPTTDQQPITLIGLYQGTNLNFDGQGQIIAKTVPFLDHAGLPRINISSDWILQESTNNEKIMHNGFYLPFSQPTFNNSLNLAPAEVHMNFYITDVGKKITDHIS